MWCGVLAVALAIANVSIDLEEQEKARARKRKRERLYRLAFEIPLERGPSHIPEPLRLWAYHMNRVLANTAYISLGFLTYSTAYGCDLLPTPLSFCIISTSNALLPAWAHS